MQLEALKIQNGNAFPGREAAGTLKEDSRAVSGLIFQKRVRWIPQTAGTLRPPR
jgi:hypothetical protein